MDEFCKHIGVLVIAECSRFYHTFGIRLYICL